MEFALVVVTSRLNHLARTKRGRSKLYKPSFPCSSSGENMPTVYQDRVQTDGSASDKTFYGSKIPPGKVLQLEGMNAYVYTTVIGDYNSATYIALGMEVNGLNQWINCRDIKDVQTVIKHNGKMYFKEGDRPIAYFEATAASTTYVFCINGILLDKDEVK